MQRRHGFAPAATIDGRGGQKPHFGGPRGRPRATAFKLRHDLVHPVYRTGNGVDRVVDKLGIPFVFLGICHDQGLLCDQVVQIMHQEGGQLVVRLELLRLCQELFRSGRLRQSHRS